MENNNLVENNLQRKKLQPYCEKCNFQSTCPVIWLRHIESQKHKRNGKKKPLICTHCNKSLSNHFTLKIHILTSHSSKEERSKQKYYCDSCDYVFVSKLYYEKHCGGKLHKNVVKTLESLKIIDEMK